MSASEDRYLRIKISSLLLSHHKFLFNTMSASEDRYLRMKISSLLLSHHKFLFYTMSASEDRYLRIKISSLLLSHHRTGNGTLVFFNRKLRSEGFVSCVMSAVVLLVYVYFQSPT